MNYNETLNKLGSWINVIKKSMLILTGLEAFIVIIIGVASSNVYNEKYSIFWIGILIFLGVCYVIITIIKIAYKSKFPSNIIDDLIARKELEAAKSDIDRKDAINNYISQTIVDLKKCKCLTPIITDKDDWISESDKDFLRGLTSITQTFSRILNILLNTSNIKFSSGILVKEFRAIRKGNEPDKNSGIFLFRDDFGLSMFKGLKKLMDNDKAAGIELEMQNLIRTSFNNGKYLTMELLANKENKFLMICINIAELSNNDKQKGVLFILTKPINKFPNDLESVLRMFSNIISHWLDLYFHEVRSRQIELLGTEIKEESTDA